jgi:hypothetical protein
VVRIDDERIRDQLGQAVPDTVEDALNALRAGGAQPEDQAADLADFRATVTPLPGSQASGRRLAGHHRSRRGRPTCAARYRCRGAGLPWDLDGLLHLPRPAMVTVAGRRNRRGDHPRAPPRTRRLHGRPAGVQSGRELGTSPSHDSGRRLLDINRVMNPMELQST